MHLVKNPQRSMRTDRPLAAVIVHTLNGRQPRLQVTEDSPVMVKTDTYFVLLPDTITVIDAFGNPITPSGQFWISGETIDPQHVLIDRDTSSGKE